ncbi:MAG: hypothetical protein P8127_12730 [Acidobacteriota bacterium]
MAFGTSNLDRSFGGALGRDQGLFESGLPFAESGELLFHMMHPLLQFATLPQQPFDDARELGQVLVHLELGISVQFFGEFLTENVHWSELGHTALSFPVFYYDTRHHR